MRQLFEKSACVPTVRVEVEQVHVACELVEVGVGIALADEQTVLGRKWRNIVTRPLAPNVPFCCMMIAQPEQFLPGCRRLTTPGGRRINFYALAPLHRNEMEYKLNRDSDGLIERLRAVGVTELLDISRPSVVGGQIPG